MSLIKGAYSQLRNSQEGSQVSSGDECFDLGELDPLTHTEAAKKDRKCNHKQVRHERHPIDPTFDSEERTVEDTIRTAKRGLQRRGKCLLITMIMFGAFIVLLSAASAFAYKMTPRKGESPPWYPTPRGGTAEGWKESYRKAEIMVRTMSLMEKVNVTTGVGWEMGLCVGNTGPAIGAGFPALCLQDGPLGLRFADQITAFPAGITTGATWNRELMYQRGRALGKEARLKGVNVILGPSMGALGRMPAGGRNWEGFGSDPVLQGVGAAETIRGIQEEGVMATAKHFIGNEQEHFRQSFEWGLPNAMSSNIDDRTLHELYLWPFADSVKAGVASVMCSYQMVNNSYSCGNSKLLNGILKDELGFQGFVQSDWLAQRSGVDSALAGLDMSMPGDGLLWADGSPLWGSQLTKAVLNTSVPMERIDDMVTRIVASWYQLGQDDQSRWPRPPPEGDGGPNFSSWTHDKIGRLHTGSDDEATGEVNKHINVQGEGEEAHGILVRRIAAEGTVLVKNINNTLPLSRNGWAVDTSAADADKMMRIGVFGEDSSAGDGPNACFDRGCNQGTLASGWGSGSVDFPYLITPLSALNSSFNQSHVSLSSYPTNQPPDNSIITSLDICLVFLFSDGGEGYLASDGVRGDRNDLLPQKDSLPLIQTVASQCSTTIAIIHAVGPVTVESWINLPSVKAVLYANLPGQESGNALADVLFGDINPSGKLPYTVGRSLSDYGQDAQVMYHPNAAIPQQNFSEGVFIDYRHFDRAEVAPQYEFGFGLSYTTFHLSNITITTLKAKTALAGPRPDPAASPPSYGTEVPRPRSALWPKGFRKLNKYIYPYLESVSDVKQGRYPYPKGWETPNVPSPAGGAPGGHPALWDVHVEVRVWLRNTGKSRGKEVVQLYVGFPEGTREPRADSDPTDSQGPEVEFPVKVLRGFEKVELDVGEEKEVCLQLRRRDLSWWSARFGNWIMPVDGTFRIMVGTSSRDLPLWGRW